MLIVEIKESLTAVKKGFCYFFSDDMCHSHTDPFSFGDPAVENAALQHSFGSDSPGRNRFELAWAVLGLFSCEWQNEIICDCR